MEKILVTGACGQIGSELVLALAERFGAANIIASDIKKPPAIFPENVSFYYLDVTNMNHFNTLVVEQQVTTIFHMAAILSAVGEQNPQLAYRVNMYGLINALEAARIHKLSRVVVPSSIAAFGPDAPKKNTPDDTALNPTTMYGVTKVAGEKLIQYYHLKYGVDGRSLRYPGIISSETLPGGGTTDYAVDLYINAVKGEPYRCYISENTPLPFMYMPDAIKAIIELAFADGDRLTRRVYNVHAMSLTPGDIVASIRKYYPDFQVTYQPDYRQQIAESWPHSIDDSNARRDWHWQPDFNLDDMTRDMLNKLKSRFGG